MPATKAVYGVTKGGSLSWSIRKHRPVATLRPDGSVHEEAQPDDIIIQAVNGRMTRREGNEAPTVLSEGYTTAVEPDELAAFMAEVRESLADVPEDDRPVKPEDQARYVQSFLNDHGITLTLEGRGAQKRADAMASILATFASAFAPVEAEQSASSSGKAGKS